MKRKSFFICICEKEILILRIYKLETHHIKISECQWPI